MDREPSITRQLALIIIFFAVPVFCAGQVPLLDLVDELGAEFLWEPYRRIGTIGLGGTRVTFKADTGTLVINYSEEIREGGISVADGMLVAADSAAVYMRSLFSRYVAGDGPSITAVVIDPGHGGKDPGANHIHVFDGKTISLMEKDIVLDISIQLKNLLLERFPQKQIILTRSNDVYLQLEERVEIANNIDLDDETDAIIFISVHANASLNSATYGYEVWYLPPEYGRGNLVSKDLVGAEAQDIRKILNSMKDEEFTVESVLLAQHILTGFDTMIGDTSKNLGLKEESWFVVRNAKMPSVLVELGFITNTDEAALMADPVHLRKMTLGLYNGVTDFITEFESKKGFTE
ncbi:MAG: N-acetylmuramoyl-L-alanine amidase [Spirochaetales bacterium]|jgi:N-acetylmuramoyl-L-alanine amidase|nr:N-acetylmuramoyl-L-alanine amidase [Spirochaetales bacterium]